MQQSIGFAVLQCVLNESEGADREFQTEFWCCDLKRWFTLLPMATIAGNLCQSVSECACVEY
jgi:hypothetical protein